MGPHEASIRQGMPDYQVVIADIVAAGDKVAVRSTLR
jgi:hypothetical protein